MGADPIAGSERYGSLDLLRGFALLGILMMNIQSFSMPGSAYLNPTSYGDLSGINLLVWRLGNLFFDMKFMSLFSMLFGAGVVVFAERAARSGGAGWLHYRRTFWLLVLGLLHAHLLWYGDILVMYALCALWVYLFRNRSPRTLIIAGLLFTAIGSGIYLLFGFGLPNFPAEAVAEIRAAWMPTPEQHAATIAAVTGSFSEHVAYNSQEALFLETFVFLTLFLWRATGMMLIGMALYKLGVLKAESDPASLRRLLVVAGIIGLGLAGYGLYRNTAVGFSLEYSFYLGSQWNYWGSLGLALAYLAGVMLWAQSSALGWLQERLRAVGRMAFSNYIMQTLLCTGLFYGWGLGYYGQFERWQQLLVVLAVWVLQVWLSPVWLARYRFGPLEWLWRSLTYWRLQPLKR